MKLFFLNITFIILSFTYSANASQLTQTATSGSKLKITSLWENHSHGVSFSLKQIVPIAVKSFYLNRGFTENQIKAYSFSCVFAAILRNNNAPGKIHFISNNWKVLVNGEIHPLVSTEQWLQGFSNNNAKKSALIAFRWAQFPHEQEYEPGGDWNQGMLSIGLPPGSQFDIIADWDINNKKYEVKLE